MATANGVQQFDAQGRILQLDERVTNIRAGLTSLEGEMRGGFAQSTASMTTLGAELRGAITSLGNEMRGNQKTQWPVILMTLGLVATAVGFIFSIGIMALTPVREGMGENRQSIRELSAVVTSLATAIPDAYISRKESDVRSARNAEDRSRVDKDIADLSEQVAKVRDTYVPMNQWTEQIHGRDVQIADLATRFDASIAEINRRADETRASIGNVYSARDVIMDLRNQLIELRQRFEKREPPA